MNKLAICPQKMCDILSSTLPDNVNELATSKDFTDSVPSNINYIEDSLYLPEVTGAGLVKIINNTNNEKNQHDWMVGPLFFQETILHV
jgi:hypothetical protein